MGMGEYEFLSVNDMQEWILLLQKPEFLSKSLNAYEPEKSISALFLQNSKFIFL